MLHAGRLEADSALPVAEQATAHAIARRMVVIYVLASVWAVVFILPLIVFGLEFKTWQWLSLFRLVPPGFALYVAVDIIVIFAHLRPVRQAPCPPRPADCPWVPVPDCTSSVRDALSVRRDDEAALSGFVSCSTMRSKRTFSTFLTTSSSSCTPTAPGYSAILTSVMPSALAAALAMVVNPVVVTTTVPPVVVTTTTVPAPVPTTLVVITVPVTAPKPASACL